MKLAPILLFVYNRLRHTKETVAALQRNELAPDSELFIYSDGPKDDDLSRTAVSEVREYLREIKGFRKINIVERRINLGLANSVIKGVSEIIDKYGTVIVLEDDLLTAPVFLRYMNQALARYENEEQVMQISGHMFDVDIDAETDAVFLPFTTSWGWATWKRAWGYFDPLVSGYEMLRRDRALRHKFNLDGSYNYFKMLRAQIKGNIDSWAIRWYLSVFMKGGLTLYPVNSFVRNIGFDGSGTHCGSDDVLPNTSFASCSGARFANSRFPDTHINEEVFLGVKMLFGSKGSIVSNLRQLRGKVIRIFGFNH